MTDPTELHEAHGAGASAEPTVSHVSLGETAPTVQPQSRPPHAAAPQPGGVPGYELLGLLGRGGMGVVYQARQLGLNRLVALKMIRTGPDAGTDEIERFRLEAEAIARLRHPGIVQIYEIGEHRGEPFFSLEYIEGGGLDKHLPRVAGTPEAIAKLARTLALAVQAAHEQGVVHRDLKPANILLGADGTPKITDFGLAKRLDGPQGQTRTGAIMGTPTYMAPEQAWGKTSEVGPAADVYALGAILYEMLTGRPPFRGSTLVETLEMVRVQEPVPPSQLQPKVPRDLETICLKCLQKEPPRRYMTAADLAEDLRRYLAQEPLQARPVSRPERAWRWCRRNPVVASLLAAVVTSLALGAGIATFLALRAADLATQAINGAHQLELKNKQLDASLQRERQRADSEAAARREAKELNQALLIDQNLQLLGQGESKGLAGLAQVLSELPADARELDRVARVNLAAWARAYPPLRTIEARRVPRQPQSSPDGRWTLRTNGQQFQLWDESAREPGPPLKTPKAVLAYAFTPDSRLLATGDEEGVRLWGLPSGEAAGELPHPMGVRGLAFSPDGRRLATACDDARARVWDVRTRRPAGRPIKHMTPVGAVAFSADGRTLLTEDQRQQALHWDLAELEPVPLPVPYPDTARVAAFSPDGRWLAAGGAEGVLLWPQPGVSQPGPQFFHPAPVCGLAFSPDSRMLATTCLDGQLRLWETSTGRLLTPPLPCANETDPQSLLSPPPLLFRPDGKALLSLREQRTANLWEVPGGCLLGQLSHGFVFDAASFRPDGTVLVSSGMERPPADGPRVLGLRRWSPGDGAALGPPLLQRTRIRTLAFSPDCAWIVLGVGQSLRLQAASDLSPGGHFAELGAYVRSVAFSPDGQALAAGTKEITFWSVPRLKPLGPPIPQGGWVMGLAFSPDGRTLAATIPGRPPRLWPVPQPVQGTPERLAVWAQLLLGRELDPSGTSTHLDAETWRELRRRLLKLGGPP